MDALIEDTKQKPSGLFSGEALASILKRCAEAGVTKVFPAEHHGASFLVDASPIRIMHIVFREDSLRYSAMNILAGEVNAALGTNTKELPAVDRAAPLFAGSDLEKRMENGRAGYEKVVFRNQAGTPTWSVKLPDVFSVSELRAIADDMEANAATLARAAQGVDPATE